MGEHASWITLLVNHYLGGAALALLSALHIRPTNPDLPIPEHVVMGLLVLLVGTIFACGCVPVYRWSGRALRSKSRNCC